MNRTLSFSLLLVSAVALSGCADGGTEGSAQIDIKDDFFDLELYEAAAGEPVTWKNVGKRTHTVTVQRPGGAPGDYLYNEELIGPGGTAEFAFPDAGTYDVFCIYHSQGASGDFSEGMVMKVHVA